jgi:hypothetical protein
LLAILTLAFLLRVLGQVLVAFFDVGFLPAMEHWYSGLMPYPVLLPVQIVMLVIMFRLVGDVWRGSGWFARPRRRAGSWLKWFSYVYFAAMVVRYVLTMGLHPELRWFAHTIPIWFHMVLAAFLYVYGRYHCAFAAAAEQREADS